MRPSRARRKPANVSSDEEAGDMPGADDILSDEDYSSQSFSKETTSPLKALRDVNTKATKSRLGSTKPSPSKSGKGKAAQSKGTNGPGKGSIVSFFTAAAQNQRTTSSQTPSPAKVASQEIHEDITDDIEDNHGDIALLNGSRTAQAARKRKQNDVDHLSDPAVFAQAAGSLKFRKGASGARLHASAEEVDQRPWGERFGPVDLSELGVHTKKVSDVRAMMARALSSEYGPRLIVLKGPAGTGKTTTVRLLARDMGVVVKEWRNPTEVDIGTESFRSYSSQFEEFVFMSGRFAALDLATGDQPASETTRQPISAKMDPVMDAKRLLLIEDFPISLARSSTILQSFRSALTAYLSMPNSASHPPAPIVVIVSETLLASGGSNDSLTPNRLLGPALLTHPFTAQIEFNPVAQTFLTKALSLIVVKESRVTGRRRTPGPAVLAKLAETGDIRSAVSGLEMLCLMGDDSDVWSSKVSFTRPKGTTKAKTAAAQQTMTEREREALKVVSGREGTLGLWHAVGKVVYNKRLDASATQHARKAPKEALVPGMTDLIPASEHQSAITQPPSHLPHHRRPKVPENDPEQLLAELSSDIPTFVASIHENFVQSCATNSSETTLDSLDACLDALSSADILSIDRFTRGFGTGTAIEGLRQDEIAFHTAVRGVVFGLPYPVKRETGGGGQGAARRGGGGGPGNVMAWPRSLKLWREREEIDDLVELVMDDYARVLTGVTRGLSSAYAAGSDAADDGEVGETTTLGMPSASSKAQVVLEQAPYMRLIHDAKRTSSSLRDRVRQVVELETLHASTARLDGSGEGQDEDEEADHIHRERRTRTGKKDDAAAGLALGLVERDVKELVLEDDDIIDD